jgi:hypothetical protein
MLPSETERLSTYPLFSFFFYSNGFPDLRRERAKRSAWAPSIVPLKLSGDFVLGIVTPCTLGSQPTHSHLFNNAVSTALRSVDKKCEKDGDSERI